MALRVIGKQVAAIETRRVTPAAKVADAELLTPEHRRFRAIVLKRAGYRCEHIEDGARCTKSAANGDRMVADHVVERADGGALYDPRNGQCLCVAHNTAKGMRARGERVTG